MEKESKSFFSRFESKEENTNDTTINLQLADWKLDPKNKVIIDPNNIWTIKDFLSGEECELLIRHSEKLGFGTAIISGYEKDENIRNNKRTVWTDPKFCDQIWKRAQQCVPKIASELRRKEVLGKGYESCGCYDQMRFYRYDAEEKFEPHYDYTRHVDKKKSFLSCLIYLTTVKEGGRTTFFENNTDKPTFSIAPVAGSCLFFVHGDFDGNCHEGGSLPKNSTERKYVLRTDIMYRPLPKSE
jgi:hypothetical protein